MPHSAGGGSFGGGAYHGGSSGGGNAHRGLGRMYKTKQPGTYRYVYYGRNHTPHYFYMRGRGGWSILTPVWVFSICALIIWFVFIVNAIEPLDTSLYDSGPVIEDHLGLMKEADIKPAMQKFQDTTGVSAAVEVVTDSEWNADYDSVEEFAYDEYDRMFDDEYHLLTVISYPDDYKTNELSKWNWHMLVGDDCGSAITDDLEGEFVEDAQECLKASTTRTLGSSMSAAFQKMISDWKTAYKNDQEWSGFMNKFSIVVLIVIVLANIWGIRKFLIQKNAKRA